MIDLKDMSTSELENLSEELVCKRFPGRQLFGWIHKHNVTDFNAMTNISKEFREMLKGKYYISRADIVDLQQSKLDGTRKLLLKLNDGEQVETVWIPGADRSTICVSSQVGCPLACRFCLTGLMKMKRNLTAGEIAEQVYSVKAILQGDEDFRNIVFMGMGEPFLNYDSVIAGLDLLMSDLGLGIAQKRVTISTVGIVPGIFRLADSGLKVMLAVSLHSADDDLRSRLVPANKKYPLSVLVPALKYYTETTGRRLTFEYCLIGGVNDSIDSARKLVSLIHDIPCKINLLAYNAAPGLPKEFRRPSEDSIERFRDYLYPRCPAVTIRKSRGADILAACGQLATGSKISEKKT
ncbi:MAG: 23S rRNA (adenine(2503)-C(2))-methyltransferase RlmN [Candidatus Zixiibacteriota bacterium]